MQNLQDWLGAKALHISGLEGVVIQVATELDEKGVWNYVTIQGPNATRQVPAKECQNLSTHPANPETIHKTCRDALLGRYGALLQRFVVKMERELRANAAKGDRPGWLQMSPDQSVLEIYWHVAKLSAAIKNRNLREIDEYSADVANMAMMALDIQGGLLGLDDMAAPEEKTDAPD